MMMSFQEFREQHCQDCYFDGNEVSKRYAEYFRERAEVGDGVSVHLWTDSHAYTIIKRTAKTLTLQRAKATLDPNWKPEFIPGGFCAHCTNDSEQKWIIEPNPKGEKTTAYWSDVRHGFYVDHDLHVTAGYYEHYDYNF